MLAGNFAAVRQPAGLKHLIVTNTPASMALWERSTAGLMKQLPQDVQGGTTSAQEYQDAMMVFYKQHACRFDTWPEDILASFSAMATKADPKVYNFLFLQSIIDAHFYAFSGQGSSELTITGTLKTWTIVDILDKVRMPILMMNSIYDGAQDV